MLSVATYLDRSTVHGIGLFAAREIEPGTVVWEFNPAVDLAYTLDQWQALKVSVSFHSFANLRRLSFKENGRIYLCLDNAQFMNHSETNENVAHVLSKDKMEAVRQISRGEELLCNYLSYSDPDDFHIRSIRDKILK